MKRAPTKFTGKDCNKSGFRCLFACYSAVNATVRPLIGISEGQALVHHHRPVLCSATACCRTARTSSRKRASSTSATVINSLSDREYSGYIATALVAEP